MKKFKLIKQYPGSGVVGTITELTQRMNPAYFTDNPDFYEEVVEKDYEILISRVVPQEILSVKRLSDGEVFTVGDLVKTPYTDCTRIVGFKNPEAEEFFIEISTGFSRLISLEKIKQPIFLTHNGKDIFTGDKVWYVNKENFYYDYILTLPQTKFYSDIRAYFLTRVEAEEYIAKNKPLFISEDGYDIKEGDMYYFVDTDFSVNMAKALKGCGQYSERKYFATLAAAENCAIQHSRVLSVEDFNNAITSQYGNYNVRQKLIQIVKERLNLK